jgi:hypothetical protein
LPRYPPQGPRLRNQQEEPALQGPPGLIARPPDRLRTFSTRRATCRPLS